MIHHNDGEVEMTAEANVKLKAKERSLKRWGAGEARMQERTDVILTLRRAASW